MTLRNFLLVTIIFTTAFVVPAEDLTHDNAPKLSDTALQELRNGVALAKEDAGRQSASDTKTSADQEQLTSMIYTLALQQYHSIPAYRDLYKSTLNRLIERMLEKKQKKESAHHIIALYEMLYHDMSLSLADTPIDIETISRPDFLPDGLSQMYEKPWTRKKFGHPVVAHVDFPKVFVRQAIWDDENEVLLFTLEPRGDKPVLTTFFIENLYTNHMAELFQNDVFIAGFDEHAQVAGKNTRNLDPGQVEIRTTLDGPTQFILKPME